MCGFSQTWHYWWLLLTCIEVNLEAMPIAGWFWQDACFLTATLFWVPFSVSISIISCHFQKWGSCSLCSFVQLLGLFFFLHGYWHPCNELVQLTVWLKIWLFSCLRLLAQLLELLGFISQSHSSHVATGLTSNCSRNKWQNIEKVRELANHSWRALFCLLHASTKWHLIARFGIRLLQAFPEILRDVLYQY